jgi:hypothetical protein
MVDTVHTACRGDHVGASTSEASVGSTGLGSVHIGEGDARVSSWRSLGRKHGLQLSTQNLVTTSMASSGRGAGCIGARGRGIYGLQESRAWCWTRLEVPGGRSRMFGSKPMPLNGIGKEKKINDGGGVV